MTEAILHVELPEEKKTAFKVKCATQKVPMNTVVSSLIDDVLADKWDKWESLRSRR